MPINRGRVYSIFRVIFLVGVIISFLIYSPKIEWPIFYISKYIWSSNYIDVGGGVYHLPRDWVIASKSEASYQLISLRYENGSYTIGTGHPVTQELLFYFNGLSYDSLESCGVVYRNDKGRNIAYIKSISAVLIFSKDEDVNGALELCSWLNEIDEYKKQ